MRGTSVEPQTLTVALRVRPMNSSEINIGACHVAHVMDSKLVVLRDPNEEVDDILRAHRSRERQYAFDHAFGAQSSQEDVYRVTVRGLIDGVLRGINSTVFAYGPTGAGKTFTMLGKGREAGIMGLTLGDLYRHIDGKAEEMRYTVTISYLEIYNEMIRDLLAPSSGFLELREDPKGVNVVGLMEVETSSVDEIMDLLSVGNSRRTCEPTAVNKTSSRSHAVLQVVVEGRGRVLDLSQEVCTGRLFMVDLAGSERAAQTQNRGKRMIEGAHINRSLLALGNCINALGCSSKAQYVNYRDSKLTRLLKDSLGGNCRTVMIAHISPASSAFEESCNTLKYAERAKHIKTMTRANVHDVSYHIIQYTNIIADLRREIERLKAQLAARKEPAPFLAPPSSEASGAVAELREVLAEQGSTRQELFRTACKLAQNAFDVQRTRLKQEHFPPAGDGGDTDDNMTASDNVTDGDNDPLDFRSSMGSRDSGTVIEEAPVGGTHDKAAEGLHDISVLKRQRKRFVSKQKTLLRKMTHLKRRAVDLNERVSEVVQDPQQKETVELLHHINELSIQSAEQGQVSAATGLHLMNCEMLIEHLMDQNQSCMDAIKRQMATIHEHGLPCAEEVERTFQKLAHQQHYLSEWFACSASLAGHPSNVHLTDNADDGDDEASSAPSPMHRRAAATEGVARGLMSPQDMTISSVASLISVGKPQLPEVDPISEDDTALQTSCTGNSSKDPMAQRKKTGKCRSLLSPLISPCPSDLSQSEDEDRLPAIKSDRMSETLQSIRQSYTQGSRGMLPAIQSPPLISVSRCSAQSQSQLKGSLQSQRRSPSLTDSTRSLTAISDVSLTAKSKKAWNVKTKVERKQPSSKVTISDRIRKKLAPAKHRLPARHHLPTSSTAEEMLQMATEPKAAEEKCPLSVASVPATDGNLRRKKKAALRRQPLALGTARTGLSGGDLTGPSVKSQALQKARATQRVLPSPYLTTPFLAVGGRGPAGKGKSKRKPLAVSGLTLTNK